MTLDDTVEADPQQNTRSVSALQHYSHYVIAVFGGLALVLIAFLLGTQIASSDQSQDIVQNVVQQEKVYLSDSPAVAVRSMDIPAVSSSQEGVTGTLTVSVREGKGHVFLNIANILVKEDAAHSLRKAAEVAYNISDTDMSQFDTTYFVNIDSPAIEGSSAGAMATIATYAAITNQELNEDVMLTGTIHYDGTIGPASGIREKAEAAAESGKEMLLVPPHQATKRNVSRSEVCEDFGGKEFCNEEVRSQRISIAEVADIQVKEVRTIQEALDYLIVEKGQ